MLCLVDDWSEPLVGRFRTQRQQLRAKNWGSVCQCVELASTGEAHRLSHLCSSGRERGGVAINMLRSCESLGQSAGVVVVVVVVVAHQQPANTVAWEVGMGTGVVPL